MTTMEEYVRQVNTNIELSQEIERLKSIIKEVREYVETMYTYGVKNNSLQRNELLEILDKVEEK